MTSRFRFAVALIFVAVYIAGASWAYHRIERTNAGERPIVSVRYVTTRAYDTTYANGPSSEALFFGSAFWPIYGLMQVGEALDSADASGGGW